MERAAAPADAGLRIYIATSAIDCQRREKLLDLHIRPSTRSSWRVAARLALKVSRRSADTSSLAAAAPSNVRGPKCTTEIA
jgi:hypothetical protein